MSTCLISSAITKITRFISSRIKPRTFTGEQLFLMLPTAHKYCMEKIEKEIIEELKKTSSYEGFIDLIVASRVIDSDQLYQDGLHRLISSGLSPTMAQANRMGSEATHTVMTAYTETLKATNVAEMNRQVALTKAAITRDLASVRAKADAEIAALRAQLSVASNPVPKGQCRWCARRTYCNHCDRSQ